MTQIALIGAGGKMGFRLSANLAASDFAVRHVEISEAGRGRLRDELGVSCVDSAEALDGADALVIVTEWNAFRALDLTRVKSLLKSPVMIDLRNIYNPDEMIAAGFSYTSVGRPLIRKVASHAG